MKKESMKSNPALSVGSPVKEQQISRLLSKRFPSPKNDEILVCPLGGVGEIGMNWTLYGHAGRWVLVDAGIMFAREFPSVEAVFVDPETFKDIMPSLDAMILTHAHEDHIGAVARIWPRVGCPVYATPFSAEVLSLRLKEAGIKDSTEIRVFKPGDCFKVSTFTVQTVHLTHSAPECVGLVFETPAGKVFHTGDWKFDDDPVVGKPTDKDQLRRLGDSGVLAMVCDSTNADRPGRTTSEGELYETFVEIMRDFRTSIIVTCFGSNVARMKTVLKAADNSNRYTALSGRTMFTFASIARELGMFEGVHEPISRDFLSHCDRQQRVLLCTGTQGEERASLSRLAHNDLGDRNPLPPVEAGDVVVFSSSVIPGNENDIQRVKDALRERGAIIIEGDYRGKPIAASGHAKADELAEMNDLIRPRFVIPVHGTAEHQDASAGIALSGCVEAVTKPQLGQVISITEKGTEVVAEVEVKLMCQYVTSPWVAPVFGAWNEDVKEALRNPPDELVAVAG